MFLYIYYPDLKKYEVKTVDKKGFCYLMDSKPWFLFSHFNGESLNRFRTFTYLEEDKRDITIEKQSPF